MVAVFPASYFDCSVFSFEVGLAKPDPEIYMQATRRLGVAASDTWFIGDGAQEELSGAEQAGLRAFRALWFLRRWLHFTDEPSSTASVASVEDLMELVEQSNMPLDSHSSRPSAERQRRSST